MKKKILMLICCLPSIFILAQNTIGLPDITNYAHEKINSGAQTWQIAQDRLGIMYFANNSGLLTFNNKEWRVYPLPNKTIVRSLYIDKDDKIYVGGQGIIGYFFPNRNGILQFHSLNNLIPAPHQSFEDVWYILSYKDEIFFQSSKKVFKLNKGRNKIDTYKEAGEFGWSFMGVAHDQLLAQNSSQHFVRFDNNSWVPVKSTSLKHTLITGAIDVGKDTTIISTLKNGLFLFTSSGIQKIKLPRKVVDSQIFRIYKMNKTTFAVGTVSNGIFLMNIRGDIAMHFSTNNGMQNNNVLSLFTDGQSNLWAGLDEGIDLIDYSSPIHRISPMPKPLAPAYTSLVFDRRFYVGTSDGVYFTPLTVPVTEDISYSKENFTRIKNSNRQVWNLCSIDNDKLFMSHHDGAFIIEDNHATVFYNNSQGNWLFRLVPGTSKMIAGTYTGFQLFENKKGYLPFPTIKSTLNESLRFIEIDSVHHVIWASHPYRGVYKIEVSKEYDSIQRITLLTKSSGLPNSNSNFVFKINTEVIFATEKGIYEFNYSSNRFVVSNKYRPVFGEASIKFITEDQKKRIWFATENKTGVVDGHEIKYIPELDGQLIAGFENIYPYNDYNIFIGSYKGIIHLNYDLYQQSTSKISVKLNKVVAAGKKDSVLFEGYFVKGDKLLHEQPLSLIHTLAPTYSSFHFDFSSNEFGNEDKVQYCYQLEGFDEDWSVWANKNEKDYTNLSKGKYTFKVKAKDNFGTISPIASYAFIIRPRWYETSIAYGSYILLFMMIVFSINKIHQSRLIRQKERYEKEQSHLKYVHELELEHTEKQIIQLKNEKLETEVTYKNKELATTTMHLYKRGRLLGKIKDDLSAGIANLTNKDDKIVFKQLMKLLVDEERQDQGWEQFSIHFDQVHNNFLSNIKKAYPLLTPADLKICAYLKMNLSSKEIAQLLNISLKGVEIGRYRLRKKLSLGQHVNLTNFINEFG